MKLILIALFLAFAVVNADIYLHAPPGSNCRNRERSDNRNNGDRMFDSQNNNKGGYAWRGDPTMRGKLTFDDIPDPLVYLPGSKLRMEWTNQHGCGPNKNVECQMVIQYACHDPENENLGVADPETRWLTGLRDGYPDSASLVSSDNTYDGYQRLEFRAPAIDGTNTQQNQDGTNTIPDNAFPDDVVKRNEFYYEGKHGGVEFGMHEGYAWYDRCKKRSRNMGLYTSDQAVNGRDSRRTRQNPNGNRRGLECPEERDYYPYWEPTPWRDVAVLTSNTEWCNFYKDNSQNVVSSWYCDCDEDCRTSNAVDGLTNLIPITEAECTAKTGVWTERTRLGGGAPECMYTQFGRDNHLGNAAPVDSDGKILANKYQPETAFYDWTIPSEARGKWCVARLRYNITTGDYPANVNAHPDADTRDTLFNVTHNCPRRNGNNALPISIAQGLPEEADLEEVTMPHCQGILDEDRKPLFERPYINLFDDDVLASDDVDTEARQIAIALNTDQTGRTFQDRTHVFKVADSGVSSTVWNLGVRGRRGNIVQCYPSVEYDFTPNRLVINDATTVHIQLHGSDFNAAKNANNGEGWRYSDRHNLVEVANDGDNYPLPASQMRMFGSVEAASYWALLDQTNCGIYYYNGNDNDRTTTQNQADNCAQLNRAPNRFPQNHEDGLVSFSEGEYAYVSTRNNNFSNRSHKARLIVGEAPALSAGEKAAIAVGSIAAAGILIGGVLFYGKKNPNSAIGGLFSRGASSTASASTAPDMVYQRTV